MNLLKELTLVFTATICSFSIFGCDGLIRVKGHVYAQKNAGESQGVVDHPLTIGNDLMPLKGARVTLYHSGDYSKEKASQLLKDSTVTSADGSFEAGGVTSPFRFNAGLVIEREGYKPVTIVFQHEKGNHEATIILAPDGSTAGQNK
jgi:hypothetical protein